MGTVSTDAAGGGGSAAANGAGGSANGIAAAPPKPLNAAFSTWPTTVFEVRPAAPRQLSRGAFDYRQLGRMGSREHLGAQHDAST